MTDEKSSRSEAWKDKFKEVYIEACRQIDKLNRKMFLAKQAMDEAKGELRGMSPDILEMVSYEMMVRFALEKHKVSDMMFARVSSIMDKRRDGKVMVCPDCRGEDAKCKGCGGVGRVIDHEFSLNFKILSAIGDLSRLLWEMKKGDAKSGQNPEHILNMAFEQLYAAGLRGKDAEAQLTAMSKSLGFSEEDGKQFYELYEQFCKQKEGKKGKVEEGKVDGGEEEKRT